MTAKYKIVCHTKIRWKLKELCKASTCTSLVSANISDVMDNNGKSSISNLKFLHDSLAGFIHFKLCTNKFWVKKASLNFNLIECSDVMWYQIWQPNNKIVCHTKIRWKLKELCKASTCTSWVSTNLSDQMGNNSKSSITSNMTS
jgi:hypothetical protein